nr:hypothetical protein [uncultured Cupriavidus sp.]
MEKYELTKVHANTRYAADGCTTVTLCVDLDGTLIKGDTLIYSVYRLALRSPWWLPLLPVWLLKGKANLKAQIAARQIPSPERLPYDVEFLAWIKGQVGRRPIVLATAADYRIAEAVAEHLGCFDRVIATRGTNLSGRIKADALVTQFGAANFDYAGNAREDLSVWRVARGAIVVDAPRAVEREAMELCTVLRVYRRGICVFLAGSKE